MQSLDSYILLAKSIQGVACEKLIQDVTSDPGIYVFSELLDIPSIQQSSNLNLLHLFAFGTWKDAQNFDLNPMQIKKLKQLSLVSLAYQNRMLKYQDLMRELQVDKKELQNIMIDSIYQELIIGKLDQKNQVLVVESFIGRDVQETPLQQLYNFSQSCQNTVKTLDQLIKEAQETLTKKQADKNTFEQQLQAAHQQFQVEPSMTRGLEVGDKRSTKRNK